MRFGGTDLQSKPETARKSERNTNDWSKYWIWDISGPRSGFAALQPFCIAYWRLAGHGGVDAGSGSLDPIKSSPNLGQKFPRVPSKKDGLKELQPLNQVLSGRFGFWA